MSFSNLFIFEGAKIGKEVEKVPGFGFKVQSTGKQRD
jgi:hypothetical protein